jgi:hydrocephalus-inducing protein
MEREKFLKKAGKKAKEFEDKWGPIPEHLYYMPTESILTALIRDRIKHPECNAGVIFDGLHGT